MLLQFGSVGTSLLALETADAFERIKTYFATVYNPCSDTKQMLDRQSCCSTERCIKWRIKHLTYTESAEFALTELTQFDNGKSEFHRSTSRRLSTSWAWAVSYIRLDSRWRY